MTNALYLHTIFYPKEIDGNSIKDDIFDKFYEKKEGDGVSCFLTGQGHGLNIKYQTLEMLKKRNAKRPEKYKKSGYIHFESEWFLDGILDDPKLKEWGLEKIFELQPKPEPFSPTHTLLCLAPGLKLVYPAGVSKGPKVLEYNGQLSNRLTIHNLKNALHSYFEKRWFMLEMAVKEGLLNDCAKRDALKCTNQQGELSCEDGLTAIADSVANLA